MKTIKVSPFVSEQVVLRDKSEGMPVKTRIKAGLKLKL